MARVEEFREIVKQVLRDYADLGRPEGAEIELVFDDNVGHYELRYTGWQGWRRLDGSVIHLDLRGDKVWVQHDGTNKPVADDLLQPAIPAANLVLACHHPPQPPLP